MWYLYVTVEEEFMGDVLKTLESLISPNEFGLRPSRLQSIEQFREYADFNLVVSLDYELEGWAYRWRSVMIHWQGVVEIVVFPVHPREWMHCDHASVNIDTLRHDAVTTCPTCGAMLKFVQERPGDPYLFIMLETDESEELK